MLTENGGEEDDLPLRPITQSQNELKKQETEVEILEHDVDDGSDRVAEWECAIVVGLAWTADEIHDNGRGEPVRSWKS
jgi:hypothetical protein